MNWFTHMKVGSKLVLGFFAVSLIGAVIGVLGVVKTSELSDLATLMFDILPALKDRDSHYWRAMSGTGT